MTHAPDIVEKGLIAALELAGETPWPQITLSSVADRAGLSLDDFHTVADKSDLLHAIEPHFDRAMSREGGADRTETPRERLFDVIMQRFEAMEPLRAGLVSVMKWRESQPAELARLAMQRRQSAKWALVSALLDGEAGLPTGLKAVNLVWAMAKTERAWRRDQGPDFTRTMATLDRELRAAEDRETFVSGLRPRRRKKSSAPQPQPEDKPETEKYSPWTG